MFNPQAVVPRAKTHSLMITFLNIFPIPMLSGRVAFCSFSFRDVFDEAHRGGRHGRYPLFLLFLQIINVIRNPKDQAVSWFKFSKKLPYMMLEPVKQLIDCPWNEFLENYTSGQ